MPMSAAYLQTKAATDPSLITHVGLVNSSGAEPTGGSPAYARKAAGWTAAGGVTSLPADLVFDLPSGFTVAGWAAFTAVTGGTNYGGATLPTTTTGSQITYTLRSSDTKINHTSS